MPTFELLVYKVLFSRKNIQTNSKMKKLLLTLLLTGLFTASHAQEEKEAVRKIGIRFEQSYNSKMYDSIYTIFAPNMTATLSLNATRDFLTSIQKQSGKIIKRTFIKYINGSFASYKTYFEKQILSVNISVNAQSLINGLEVTEFKNDQPEAPERNSSKLQFPANGTWTVTWGGDTKSQNYHVESRAQKNAFEILLNPIYIFMFRTPRI